ncbi:MAG: C40 family peptidase [Chitinophagales bacterium]|jgi:lipoprotein Spr|nr:C40 family peptidase [Chitinophagales bacterium]
MSTRIILFILMGISTTLSSYAFKIPSDIDSIAITSFYASNSIDLNRVENPELYFEVYRWLGKPYRLGGNSMQGIDCANFVKQIYRETYNKNIDGNAVSMFPLCTTLQSVDMAAEGDLVFFKINNSNITHIGIYLQHGKFAHATLHKGVMLSDISETYYQQYFYKAGRPEAESTYAIE